MFVCVFVCVCVFGDFEGALHILHNIANSSIRRNVIHCVFQTSRRDSHAKIFSFVAFVHVEVIISDQLLHSR